MARLLKYLPVAGAAPALLGARREALSAFSRLIGPFTPHLAEECWVRVGGEEIGRASCRERVCNGV